MASNSMEELVSLCKRRGFIFQSNDIYGGTKGLYDYGPMGVELKNNLKQSWWRLYCQVLWWRRVFLGAFSPRRHHQTTF